MAKTMKKAVAKKPAAKKVVLAARKPAPKKAPPLSVAEVQKVVDAALEPVIAQQKACERWLDAEIDALQDWRKKHDDLVAAWEASQTREAKSAGYVGGGYWPKLTQPPHFKKLVTLATLAALALILIVSGISVI